MEETENTEPKKNGWNGKQGVKECTLQRTPSGTNGRHDNHVLTHSLN